MSTALSSTCMSSRLEVVPAAPEHRPVLENLLELYIHDFSEFVSVDVGEDGRFGYRNLPLYWSDPRRRPFLARFDGKLAGFVLVHRAWDAPEESEVWDMAEFFVLRRFRRRGIGAELAEKVWLLCPGKWQVRVMANNAPAYRFWQSSISRFTGHAARSTVFEVDGVAWHRFSFESRSEPRSPRAVLQT